MEGSAGAFRVICEAFWPSRPAECSLVLYPIVCRAARADPGRLSALSRAADDV